MKVCQNSFITIFKARITRITRKDNKFIRVNP